MCGLRPIQSVGEMRFYPPAGAKMRNLTGVLVLATALATSSVQAAEIPFSWSGFYIGAHGGYGWGDDRHVEAFSPPPPAVLSGLKPSGYIVGGHAGFNWQRGLFVGGLEFDMTLSKLSATSTIQYPIPPFGNIGTFSRELSIDYFGTVRGRLGFVPHQSVFLYATGGLAWAKATVDFAQSQANVFNSFDSSSATLFGYVVGAGAEASLASFGLSDVLVRVEYLHHDYGRQGTNANVSAFNPAMGLTGSSSFQSTGPITVDVVRAGISMKFWPGS